MIYWIVFLVVCMLSILYFIIWPWVRRFPALIRLDTYLSEHTTWFGKLRVSLSGLKRIIFARLVWLSGIILSVHDLILPHFTVFEPLIPQQYRVYILPAITLIGIIFEWLVKISPQPVGEVNPGVVAAVTAKPINTVAAVTATDPIVATPSQQQQREG